MAIKKGAKSAEENPQPTAAAKYPIEKLAENCRRLFGVSSCTFAGATYKMAGEYTVEEMKTHIEKWCKKEAI